MRSNLYNDVRYGIRSLRHNAGFAAAAILTIALGIGINTRIFSILNGVALRALPVPDAADLVSIHQEVQGAGRRSVHGAQSMFSTSEYRAYRDRTQTLSGIMGYSVTESLTLGGDNPEEIQGVFASCNYFDVLQITPAPGAGFTPANCGETNKDSVVVLDRDLWRNRFGADPNIVGSSITLNRGRFTVAGIAPDDFHGTEVVKASIFIPISAQESLGSSRSFYNEDRLSWLTLVGRKRKEAPLDQVRAELGVIARQIDELQPGRRTSLIVNRATNLSLPEGRREVLSVAAVVLAAFGLVLMMACANVANLLLARAAVRSPEIAVRLALGATRRRLIQQFVTESLLIALTGGLLGSLLALWTFESLLALVLSSLPGELPPIAISAEPDWNVWAFAFAVTVAAGLFFGLAPALQASKLDLHSPLKRERARRMTALLRGGLVAVQVAICAVLMISTGLLVRGMIAAQTVDPGFEYDGIAVASFDLIGAGYDETKAEAFQRDLLARARTLPGATLAAQALKMPLSPGRVGTAIQLPGDERWRDVDYNNVSPDYFALIGTPIVRGRAFTETDLRNDSSSVIVTESTAARYWPGQDPIGQVLDLGVGAGQKVRLEVMGVVKDAQITGIAKQPSRYLYLPASPRSASRLRLLVRAGADFTGTAAAIRSAVRELDPELVVRITRLEDNLGYWRTVSRFAASLSASLGILALALAAIGVYSVVSFVVSHRMREAGIRVVLGATGREIRSMILRQTMRPVIVGMIIGVAGATAASRILQSVLFGISALDPIAFVAAPLLLLSVAVAASLKPTRRAMLIDPAVTLRYE